MDRPDLPPIDQLTLQAYWLAPARAWILHQANIGQMTRILDLGCGYGIVTGELSDLSRASIFALDIHEPTLKTYPELYKRGDRVCGNAINLPFENNSLDAVFSQLVFLWAPIEQSIQEITRVIRPGGTLIAIEPDYGGMIEYPPEISLQGVWMNGLKRAGANPLAGRKLPNLLNHAGFSVKVNLFNEMFPPSTDRFALIKGLPLTPAERNTVEKIEHTSQATTYQWDQLSHLPFLLITATL